MKNLFELLNTHSNRITTDASNKTYWENSDVKFDSVIGPDGNLYNEREVFGSLKKSDLDRLRKLG